MAGALHRGWVDVKSAVTDHSDHAILAECERGEDAAKKNYREDIILGRDLVRSHAAKVPGLNGELLKLLEHVIVSHLTLPAWGSLRLPAVPEVLILHHADDLDAKMEMYVRCLTRDPSAGPFTDPDPVLKRPLWKGRTV